MVSQRHTGEHTSCQHSKLEIKLPESFDRESKSNPGIPLNYIMVMQNLFQENSKYHIPKNA